MRGWQDAAAGAHGNRARIAARFAARFAARIAARVAAAPGVLGAAVLRRPAASLR